MGRKKADPSTKVITTRTSIYPSDEVYEVLKSLADDSYGLRRRIQILLHNGLQYERSIVRVVPGLLAPSETPFPSLGHQSAGAIAGDSEQHDRLNEKSPNPPGSPQGQPSSSTAAETEAQRTTTSRKPRPKIDVDHLEDV
jgi:hypothetical protein